MRLKKEKCFNYTKPLMKRDKRDHPPKFLDVALCHGCCLEKSVLYSLPKTSKLFWFPYFQNLVVEPAESAVLKKTKKIRS